MQIKTFILSIFLMNTFLVTSQTNINRLYTFVNNSFENRAYGIISFDDYFVTVSRHYVFDDSERVTQISKFDYSGKLLQKLILPNFEPAFERPIIFDGENLVVLGEAFGGPDINRYILKRVSLNFELIDELILGEATDVVLDSEGIYFLNGNYYLYGTRLRNHKVEIIKLKSFLNEVTWKQEYPIFNGGVQSLSINSLTQKVEGVLSFIARKNDFRFIINISEENGDIISQRGLDFDYITDEPFQSMIVDNDSNYVFISQHEPAFFNKEGTRLFGCINKLSSKLDTVLYSNIFFPDSPTVAEREYFPTEIIKAHDGGYFICGAVIDYFDSNEEWLPNGFIMKFSSDMMMDWYRIYKLNLKDNQLNQQSWKKNKFCFFKNIIQKENDSLILFGYTDFFVPEIPGLAHNELWLMTLDQNGCYNGNCDEIITINRDISLKETTGNIYPNPTSNIIILDDISFDYYRIFDVNGILKQNGYFSPQIDLQELPSGVYFLHVEKDDGVDYLPYKIIKY